MSATLMIIALCILVGVVLTRVIAPRIAKGTEMLERLAAKDLTAYVPVTGTDEIGRLGEALNTMCRNPSHGASGGRSRRRYSLRRDHRNQRALRSDRRQRACTIQQDQPDRRRRAGNDRNHRRNQPQRRKRRRRQPRLGRNRRPGRRRDAGRGNHHGKDRRRHRLRLRENDLPRRTAPRKSARSSTSSRRSASKPTCWPSMPPSKPRAPANMAADSPSSPAKCAAWPNAPRAPPKKSPAPFAASRTKPAEPSRSCRRAAPPSKAA